MKYMLLAIFVLFAAQPLQVSSCDMHDVQGTTHSQHGDMQDDGGNDMDCCDGDAVNPHDNCDSLSHCGASTVAAVTIDMFPSGASFAASSYQQLSNTGLPLSWFGSPPFRPPIA